MAHSISAESRSLPARRLAPHSSAQLLQRLALPKSFACYTAALFISLLILDLIGIEHRHLVSSTIDFTSLNLGYPRQANSWLIASKMYS
ncbi:MAG TPA: hypothetical protein VG269_25065 [Tepidisphaeraceae bacterium]|jgi:hypothetical protein|nr:hypothetical protein [Tepidisphaeraceae bacterium]